MITQSELDEMHETGLWDFESHTNDLHSLKKEINLSLLKYLTLLLQKILKKVIKI